MSDAWAMPDRRVIIGLAASAAATLARGMAGAAPMSTLFDSPSPGAAWTPPSVIPSEEVLDMAIQPLRQAIQQKAQLAVSDSVKETSDILALSNRMMAAGDESYAQSLAQLPPLERRLHWLAWTLAPVNDSGLSHLVQRLPAAHRQALLAALREGEIAGFAAAVEAMLPLIPAGRADPAGASSTRGRRFEALVAQNGGPARLRAEIGAHLARDAQAKAFVDAARAALDDETRIFVLFRSMIAHFDGHWGPQAQLARLNALPVPHRVVWLVHTYRSELFNGGIEQNFSNSAGVLAPEAAAALRLVGLDAHAEAMERAIALFPQPYPRNRNVAEWPAGVADTLYGMGDDLKGEEVDPALAIYARREGVLPR